MDIRIKIDIDRFAWEDLELMENTNFKNAFLPLRKLISRFVTNEVGEYLPEDEAMAILAKLKIPEMNQVFVAFKLSFEELQAAAVPPAINSGS